MAMTGERAGNVALVTGASAGVGRACAIAFLKAGYRTVMTGKWDAALFRALASGTERRMDSFKSQDVAIMAWALATAGQADP